MKNNVIHLLVAIAMMFLGYYLLNKSDSTISKEKYEVTKNLCLNSGETIGILQDSILASTIEIGGGELTNYILPYKFTVNEKAYKATKQVGEHVKDFKPVATIWYNKANPSINTTKDPCIQLKDYDENKSIGGENTGILYMVFGGLIGLAGIQNFFSAIFALVKTLFSKGPKTATQEDSDFV